MQQRIRRTARGALAVAAFMVLAAAAAGGDARAVDACDLSALPCWQKDDETCNIKFRNKTGIVRETGCGNGESTAQARTVHVQARSPDGGSMGNQLSITAGRTGTINLEKKAKAGFATIRVVGGNKRVTLSCKDVIKILDDGLTCIVFSDKSGLPSQLLVSCGGGDVCGKSN